MQIWLPSSLSLTQEKDNFQLNQPSESTCLDKRIIIIENIKVILSFVKRIRLILGFLLEFNLLFTKILWDRNYIQIVDFFKIFFRIHRRWVYH